MDVALPLTRSAPILGMDLSNMQTRAKNVGGDIEITSEAGHGTTIMAWVPVKSPQA